MSHGVSSKTADACILRCFLEDVQDTRVGERQPANLHRAGKHRIIRCGKFFAAIAEYERAMIVLKLRAARQRMRDRDGKCEGREQYGEREGELAVIQHMKDLQAEGLTYTTIADVLNAENVPTLANGEWFPATVSRIVARALQVTPSENLRCPGMQVRYSQQ